MGGVEPTPREGPGEYPRISPSSRGAIAFQAIGVASNLICCLAGALWLLEGAWLLSAYAVLGAVLLGLFIADLVSGLLHWAFDTWLDENNCFFREVILIVREHHIKPKQVFQYSFAQEVGRSSWVAFLLTGWLFALAAAGVAPRGPALALSVLTGLIVSAGVVLMYESHKRFGHFPNPGRIVRALQAMHLILSPRHHLAGHHRPDFDRNYCLINGWADNTLGALGVWRGLEALIMALTGAEPRRNDREWLKRYGGRILAVASPGIERHEHDLPHPGARRRRRRPRGGRS